MRIRVTCADIDFVLRQVESSITELGKTREQIAKTVVGQAGVELANAMNPPHMDEAGATVKGFRTNVGGQVVRAFPGRAHYFDELKRRRSKEIADAYWAISGDDDAKGMAFLAAHGIPVTPVAVTSSEHRRVRVGKRGSVPKGMPTSRYVARHLEDAREKLADRKSSHVGLAKAGWLAAAKMAAGRSRVGGKSAAWVRKLIPLAGGIGSIKVRKDGWSISLTNTVPWASEAANRYYMPAADRQIYDRMQKYMWKMIEQIAKKAKAKVT